MFYKNWPYWLKGGIIGIIIFLIYRLLVIIETIFCLGKADLQACSPILLDIIFWPFHRLSVPIYDLFDSSIFLVLLFHIIAGAVIGLIYGKIKNKK